MNIKTKTLSFLHDVRSELERVSWPEKKVLKITTGVVVFFMLLFGFYIGIVDVIFSRIISIFLR